MLTLARIPEIAKAEWGTPPPGGRRAITINLVIFFFFALTALIFLSSTVISVRAIDADVATAINPATEGIESDTALLAKLNETVVVTGRLSDSTARFPDDLATAANAMNRTNAALVSTNASVKSIYRSVTGIDASGAALAKSATGLGVNVAGIRNNAAEVAARLDAVHTQSQSMVAGLDASNRSLAHLLEVIGPLGSVVSEIKGELGSISVHTGNMERNGLINLGNLPNDLLQGSLPGPLILGREGREPR